MGPASALRIRRTCVGHAWEEGVALPMLADTAGLGLAVQALAACLPAIAVRVVPSGPPETWTSPPSRSIRCRMPARPTPSGVVRPDSSSLAGDTGVSPQPQRRARQA